MSEARVQWYAVFLVVLTGVVVLSGLAAVGSPALDRQAPPKESLTDPTSPNLEVTAVTTNTTSPTGDAAWPMADANPANTRHFNSTGPTSPITTRWTFSVDGANQLTQPVMDDGTVYFGAYSFEGKGSDKVYAVDAWTGETRWSFSTGDVGPNTPAVFRDTVYVTSHEGKMWALNAATGQVFWEFKPGKPARPPTVANRTVYVSSGEDNRLYALDALTGKEEWAIRPERGPSQVSVTNGRVYFTGGKHEHRSLYSVNANDGSRRWKVPIGSGGRAGTPTVANSIVFVGTSGGSVFAVDAKTGDNLWHRKFTDSGTIREVAVADGAVYLGTKNGNVHSVIAETGKIRWSIQLAGRVSAPAVVNGSAYVTHGRSVSVLDAETGAERTTFTVNEPNARVISRPTVVNGSLYTAYGFDRQRRGIGYNDTRVYALGTPEMTYVNLSVSSRIVEVNESVTATVTVTNGGTGPGSFNATLSVNGTDLAAKSGTLDAQAQTTVTFTLTFPANGTYTVDIANLERTMAVGDVASPPTATPTQTSSPATTPKTTLSTTATPGSPQTMTTTPAPTPGFGVAIWLVAFAFAVGLFVRRCN